MKIRVTRKPIDAYQHGNLAEALVQAGLKLLSEGGVDKLSLRAAAQLAGVSHAAPYRHFRDKDALVAAIAERGFRLLDRFMKDEIEALAPEAPTRSRLTAIGIGYLRFATTHPAYLQVIFGGVLGKAEHSPLLRQAGADAYQTLLDVVKSGAVRGELRARAPEDVDRLALASWSLVHGLATLIVNGAIPAPSTALALRDMTVGILRALGEGIWTGATDNPSTSPAIDGTRGKGPVR